MILYPPTPEGISAAADAMRDGLIVAYPTETVYGLGVNPFDAEAVELLFEAKGRDAKTPIPLIVASIDDVDRVAAAVSPEARYFMEYFWPGPLSLLLPKAPDISGVLTARQPKVAVRCPNSDAARALCSYFGGPVTATSANKSGRPAARSVGSIHIDEVECGIDGGTLPPSKPSTIYDPDEDRIIREGVITARQIAECWEEFEAKS